MEVSTCSLSVGWLPPGGMEAEHLLHRHQGDHRFANTPLKLTEVKDQFLTWDGRVNFLQDVCTLVVDGV
jgi:hypothetical protein